MPSTENLWNLGCPAYDFYAKTKILLPPKHQALLEQSSGVPWSHDIKFWKKHPVSYQTIQAIFHFDHVIVPGHALQPVNLSWSMRDNHLTQRTFFMRKVEASIVQTIDLYLLVLIANSFNTYLKYLQAVWYTKLYQQIFSAIKTCVLKIIRIRFKIQ